MADFMVKGTRYRETFDAKEQAVKWEQDMRHALKFDLPLPEVANGRDPNGGRLDTLGPLHDHVKRTYWDRAKGSRATIKYAKEIVGMLGRNTRVETITTLRLEELCNEWAERGNTQGTINRKLSAISKILTCADKYGVIKKKPHIPKGKELLGQIRFLTGDEEARLLKVMSHCGLDDWHDFTIIAIDTGLRLGEMMRVHWNHLPLVEYTTVTVWETKNDRPRTIPLTKRAAAAFERMLERYPDSNGPFYHFRSDGMLKTSERNLWNKACRLAGLDKRIHDLRHTCASRLVQRGVDLRRVQLFMGHTDIKTTLRYAHLAPNDLLVCVDALEM